MARDRRAWNLEKPLCGTLWRSQTLAKNKPADWAQPHRSAEVQNQCHPGPAPGGHEINGQNAFFADLPLFTSAAAVLIEETTDVPDTPPRQVCHSKCYFFTALKSDNAHFSTSLHMYMVHTGSLTLHTWIYTIQHTRNLYIKSIFINLVLHVWYL